MLDAGGDDGHANQSVEASSKVAPTMMLRPDRPLRESGSRLPDFEQRQILAPVIEIRRPRAPFIEESSISGLAIAAPRGVSALVAGRHRLCPSSPCHFAHHGATSAKSRLIRPP